MKGKIVSLSKSKKISRILSEREEENQIIFPDVSDINDLIEDRTLPLIKIIDIKFKENHTTDICFEMPILRNKADVFLIRNGEKLDMHYQISAGFHYFKNIFADASAGDSFELFYRLNNKKSIPFILNLNKG